MEPPVWKGDSLAGQAVFRIPGRPAVFCARRGLRDRGSFVRLL